MLCDAFRASLFTQTGEEKSSFIAVSQWAIYNVPVKFMELT